jgi:hypothetical protein
VFACKGKGVFSTVLRARDLARQVSSATGHACSWVGMHELATLQAVVYCLHCAIQSACITACCRWLHVLESISISVFPLLLMLHSFSVECSSDSAQLFKHPCCCCCRCHCCCFCCCWCARSAAPLGSCCLEWGRGRWRQVQSTQRWPSR